MSYYLDASVLVPRLLDEPMTEAVQHFVVAHDGSLHISDFAAGEVSSAIAKAVRDRRIAVVDAAARLADFDVWRTATTIEAVMVRADLIAADAMVRRFDLKLRLPDAIHAASCQRFGLTLVTFDKRLSDAARALGIAVTQPA